MDLDFPLILVVAVFVTGLIWLLDATVLAPRRKRRLSEHLAPAGSRMEEQSEALIKEPMLVEYSKSFFPVLFVVLILRSFLFEPFQIPSGSMLPTLLVGDFILVNKYSYGLRLPVAGTKVVSFADPQRGDVMVFKFPENPKINFIKRVVGVSGDKITYKDKRLTINGREISQKILAQLPPGKPEYRILSENLNASEHQIQTNFRPSYSDGEWVVPQGHYFVMGDNRDNSNDSRFWGFVKDDLVVGKAIFVWMHWEEFWSLPSFANVGGID